MDRSWYNRAGVERVMGYVEDEDYQRFLHQTPIVERLLIEDGIILIKYWFSVSDDEQQSRFASRLDDPMQRWKLSPTDLESILRWEDYSRAKDAMFAATDTDESPWWTVESDDKRAARLNMISHLLSSIPYKRLDLEDVSIPDRPEANDYERPPREQFRYVPDIAAELESKKKGSHERRGDHERRRTSTRVAAVVYNPIKVDLDALKAAVAQRAGGRRVGRVAVVRDDGGRSGAGRRPRRRSPRTSR